MDLKMIHESEKWKDEKLKMNSKNILNILHSNIIQSIIDMLYQMKWTMLNQWI